MQIESDVSFKTTANFASKEILKNKTFNVVVGIMIKIKNDFDLRNKQEPP